MTTMTTIPNDKRARMLIAALEQLDGHASVAMICHKVRQGMVDRGEPIPTALNASVRNGLQRHCSTSPQYGGHGDYFRNPHPGIWELVSYSLATTKTKAPPQQYYSPPRKIGTIKW